MTPKRKRRMRRISQPDALVAKLKKLGFKEQPRSLSDLTCNTVTFTKKLKP